MNGSSYLKMENQGNIGLPLNDELTWFMQYDSDNIGFLLMVFGTPEFTRCITMWGPHSDAPWLNKAP